MKVLVSLLALAMSVVPASAADPLAGLKWKKRPILLFAKSRSAAGLDKQVELLRERRTDLSERDMVVLVTEGRQDTIAAIGYVTLPQNAALELRRRFVPEGSGFTGILVGKDGTEKARWTRAIEPQEIFDLVDSMPMRQREADADVPPTN